MLARVAEGSVIMYQSPARSLCSALSNFCCAPSSAASSSLLRRSPVPAKRALSPPAPFVSSSSAAVASRCGCSAAGPGAANPQAGESSELSSAQGSEDGTLGLGPSNVGGKRGGGGGDSLGRS